MLLKTQCDFKDSKDFVDSLTIIYCLFKKYLKYTFCFIYIKFKILPQYLQLNNELATQSSRHLH